MPGQAIVRIGDKEWFTDVATLPWELSQGLGGLAEMPPSSGMLFDMGVEQTIQVTTVPMFFPLDIAFLSEDLKITELYRDVELGYLVTSQTPARYFLEVNAGELADIEAGSKALVSLLSTENAAATPDWTSAMFGFMGFLMMGLFMTIIIRDFTSEALKEPEKKTLLYGSRGEKLLAQISREVDLWVEITSVIESELGKRTDLPAGQRRQIAEVVAHRVEKRAAELAWLELRDGTTFERAGKAPVNQGLKIFAVLDGYLGLLTKLWHTDRVAVAELADSRLKEADVIVLRDGTTFRKSFKPGKSSTAVAATEEKPAGTCYADAWRFLIKEGEGRLVHGTVYSGNRRIGHAWVETESGFVWEPETGRYFTLLGFRYDFAPVEDSRCTPEEAAIMVARTKNFGPWTDQERQRYLKDKFPAVIPEYTRRPKRNDELEFLPDSPEFLAYTIDDIGYRDKLDSAFRQAISRAKGLKQWQ